ncbi:MAG: hypothetical protein JWM80_3582, partial [Cyanobacteria bacterium RYN_339]|nr:hypothetical protein [Cyanobacteria bacterium RYN_339]
PTPARADHARSQLRSALAVRVAPPPIAPPDERGRAKALRSIRAEGRGLRWVTAVTDFEREQLGLAVRAFGRYAQAATDVPELVVLVAGPWVEEAQAIATAYAPGAHLTVLPLSGAAALRTALASAQAAFFPLAAAEPRRGEGLTWAAWTAASLGLPMVLGRAPATVDGLLDHQHALLAEPNEEALAARMQFLAARPYIWPTLGETALGLVTGRLAFDRACDIPFEVYRQVLRARPLPAVANS